MEKMDEVKRILTSSLSLAFRKAELLSCKHSNPYRLAQAAWIAAGEEIITHQRITRKGSEMDRIHKKFQGFKKAVENAKSRMPKKAILFVHCPDNYEMYYYRYGMIDYEMIQFSHEDGLYPAVVKFLQECRDEGIELLQIEAPMDIKDNYNKFITKNNDG